MKQPDSEPECSPKEGEGKEVPEAPPTAETGPLLSVVGIGASAGGLRALQSLFRALPPDTGLTFVVVVHLSPEHESVLAELLQAHTEMPVRQVRERMEMEANHVYVIPPAKRLVVTEGHLDLTEFDISRGRRLQIDVFFRSLAEHYGDGAAIILSGTGSDGSMGIQSIKEGGGLILVQDPHEAEYDGMPTSAIATGLVDIVAPVADLVAQLVGAKRTRTALQLTLDPATLSAGAEQTLTQLLTQLRLRTGHDFSGYKRSTILRRIGRRMQLAQLDTLTAYLARLRGDEAEADALASDLLIHVTKFFRDPAAWAALAEEVIPQLFAGKGRNDSVRVWTTGCATGEEAYGLGMLLLEYAATLDHPPSIQIFASDLGQLALDFARQGVYPEAIAADVSEERLEHFFERDNSYYRVRKELRESILFAPHNLLQDPPFSRLDLIVCRNVLIYLQREWQEGVFDAFHYALHPHGYLFLGSAESSEGITDLFDPVDKQHRLYRRSQQRRDSLVLPSLPPQVAFEHQHEQSSASTTSHAQTEQQTHLHLLDEVGPPSLLVDDAYNVLHLSEAGGDFLKPARGTFSSNVLRLVRAELQSTLRTALARAFAGEATVRTPPVTVRVNGESVRVSLLVHPHPREKRALVLFLPEAKPSVEDGPAAKATGREVADESETLRQELEAELHLTQQRMQVLREEYETINEEARAANEELQSTNEEYRSTLEELETSQEELQSMNEELQVVNQELKVKVEETSQTNDDLQNLFAATEIATLFLDQELRIKRYTPSATELFNLIPPDRGRPIGHLHNSLQYAQLEADAREVLARLTVLEREVQGENGHWFQVNVRPYRTLDNRIDGVVLTFVDITTNKENELTLRNAKEYAESIIQTIPDALLVLQNNLRVQTANDAFYEMFQVTPEATEDHLIYALGNGQWDIPDLRTLLEEILPENNAITGYEVDHSFERVGHRTMLLNGRRLHHSPLILLTITDITPRKQAEEKVRQMNESLEEQVEGRTQQVRNLVTQLSISEQAERRRISQIIHDDLQQHLYGLQFQLTFLHNTLNDASEDEVQEEPLRTVKEIEETLDLAIRIARTLSVELSPPVLEGEGLGEAVHWLAAHMERQHGLTVQVQMADDVPVPHDELRVLLFQLVREALFNIVKHAGAAEAFVALSHVQDQLQIEVTDHGVGFDVDAVLGRPGHTHGLWQIQQRLDLVGGRMEIESSPGNGTRIAITYPLSDVGR